MGLLDLFRPRHQLVLGDCLSRKVSQATRFPMTFSGKAANGERKALCRIVREGGGFFIEALDPDSPVWLDGTRLDPEEELEPDQLYGLSVGGHLVVLRLGRGTCSLDPAFQEAGWDIANRSTPDDRLALPRSEVTRTTLARRFPEPQAHLAFPLPSQASVPLEHLLAALPEEGEEALADSQPAADSLAGEAAFSPGPIARDPSAASSTDCLACPSCWKRFSPGEALSIATHDALIGDPELGPHAKRRFAPTRFNSLGQALDGRGVVCPDLACPHCRGRLPPSFFSHRQLILSLVGAPSSGKSYYLAVLLRLLPETLIRHFQTTLQDGDPSGNARLNEMKNRLFSATMPEDAFISKTDFEGVMYERLLRDGKLAALPRPFVYYLQQRDNAERRAALVFYDNAGEHFKPGVSLHDSPGALHVAASSALLFLFDPATHPAFRKKLRRKRDPQLRTPASDEQDTILSELGVRVKTLRGLESHERVDTPLAVVVGKLDLWRSLLPPDSLALPDERPLTPAELEANSQATRSLLVELCPTLVANAESISRVVRYFPTSPLGHSPKEVETGPLAGKLAPDPRRLKPQLTDAPALWALAQLAPDLLRDTAARPATPAASLDGVQPSISPIPLP